MRQNDAKSYHIALIIFLLPRHQQTSNFIDGKRLHSKNHKIYLTNSVKSNILVHVKLILLDKILPRPMLINHT